jgi:hypothetical protein
MINQVPVNKLIEFRKLSERSQQTFANKLKIPKKPKSDDDDEGGRNYWQRGLCGVSTAFKENDNTIIKERIESLLSVYEPCDNNLVRLMYKRNLDILQMYEEFDFSVWNPSKIFKFLSKTSEPLSCNKIPLKVQPQHVFSLGNKEEPRIGGIYFVTCVKGYKSEELGIFSEAVFKFLTHYYSKQYYIDPVNCLTVDASTKEVVRYQQILDKHIPSLLQGAVDRLNKLI